MFRFNSSKFPPQRQFSEFFPYKIWQRPFFFFRRHLNFNKLPTCSRFTFTTSKVLLIILLKLGKVAPFVLTLRSCFQVLTFVFSFCVAFLSPSYPLIFLFSKFSMKISWEPGVLVSAFSDYASQALSFSF